MLNITRATTHILRVHRAKCRGYNFLRVHGVMGPRKFRQLSILKAQSRLRFPINCLKGFCKPTLNKFERGSPLYHLHEND